VAPPSLPGGQATATAVSDGQALIGETASVMAARVRGTGTSADAAAEHAFADLVKVRGAADRLTEAAGSSPAK